MALILGGCASPLLAAAGTFPLVFEDEDVIQVTGYTYASSLATLNLSSPLLCGSVGTAQTTISQKPVYGNLLFGNYDVAGNLTQTFSGVAKLNYATAQPGFKIEGDGSLVCYAVSPAGVRKPTRDLFMSSFDTPAYDSAVTLRVVELPNEGNNYVYKYYLDVSVPTVAGATQFQLRDGFDKTLFNPAVVNWCETNPGTTSCPGITNSTALIKTITLAAGQSYAKRFIVLRQTVSSNTVLPTSGSFAVIAALFVPESIAEERLDNNVAAGFGSLRLPADHQHQSDEPRRAG